MTESTKASLLQSFVEDAQYPIDNSLLMPPNMLKMRKESTNSNKSSASESYNKALMTNSGRTVREKSRSPGRLPMDSNSTKPELNEQSEHQQIRMFELKEELEYIRERRASIPLVPDPKIVQSFDQMKIIKERAAQKLKLKERIAQKMKECEKMKKILDQYRQKYTSKSQIFKQKATLLKVLNTKLQTQVSKTRQRFKEIDFNQVIFTGIRKVLNYKLAELLFNENTRTILLPAQCPSKQYTDDEIGTCVGYLGLLIDLVGKIMGARMWIKFVFKGPRSMMKLSDGSTVVLHPKDSKYEQGLRMMTEQLMQIMKYKMDIQVLPQSTFFQLCDQLSKEILGIK